MPYIGKSPSAVGVRNRFYFTASGGETSLSGSDDNGKTLVFSDASYVDVMLNGGNLVSGTDYTATPSTNTISGLTALVANDVVEIIAYDVFSVSDTVSAASGGTFQSNVNFDSGIDVTGNVTVTGNATFADNGKAIFGAGSDLQIYHDGGSSWVSDVGAGNLKLASDGAGVFLQKGATEFMGEFLTDGAVRLYYDNAAKFETTATGVDVTGTVTMDGATTSGDITFGDNNKAIFGAGSDLQIFHDGSNSFIDDAGTGVLAIRSNNIALGKYTGENLASFVADGAVTLYYDNAAKFATTATGANIAGNIELYNDDVDGYIWFHDAGTRSWSVGSDQSTGNFAITNQSNLASGHTLEINSSGFVGIGTTVISNKISLPIGQTVNIGATAGTAHQAGNVGSVGLTITDGGLANGVRVHNTHDGTYSSTDIRFTTGIGGVTTGLERMRIDSSGRVTMPYQPSFMAYGSWNYQASTYIWQGFATVDHNIGSHWNNNIGRFTAPIAGRYMIYATAHHSAVSTYHLWAFLKNGTAGGGNWVQSYDANSGSATTSKQQVWNLAAGDYLEVASNATYANGYTGGYVAVGVYLIG